MVKDAVTRQRELRQRDRRNGITTYRFRCRRSESQMFEQLCIDMSMDKSELTATLLHEKAKALGLNINSLPPKHKVIRIYGATKAASNLSELTDKLGISAKAVIDRALRELKISVG